MNGNRVFMSLVCVFIMGFAQTVYAADASSSTDEIFQEPVLHFGGCGGVYLLVEPGDFWVEVEKRDLNTRNRTTHLRAILAGPDRSVLHDVYLPDVPGSAPGPVQRVRLDAHALSTGIYALNITVTEDRYGEDIAWGFRTNCRHYLIETSRGHRDAPHEEPLVLLSPDRGGAICFLPESGAFSLDITGLSPNADVPILLDAQDRQLAVLTPDDTGAAQYTVSAEVPRDAVPWRLELSSFAATLHIDGVTRWPEGSDFPDFSFWTPKKDSWFPLHENRWLITPYSRKVYEDSERRGTAVFEVHNNASTERTFSLDLEFSEEAWTVALEEREIAVPAKSAVPVPVAYGVPEKGDAWTCHLRVTPRDAPEVSTYATLTLQRGESPASQPLSPPLVLTPYAHENEQLGYMPRYPLDNQVYFSPVGQPYIATGTGVFRFHDSRWTETTEAVHPEGATAPFRPLSSKVAFDSANGAYLIAHTGGAPALLYSRDDGASFHAYPLPGGGAFDIEQFSGHNTPDGPPPLVRYTLTERDPQRIWRRVHDLHLILPEAQAGKTISIPDPILISRKCIGSSAHSGIPSSVVSRDGKVHVVWAEATDPEEPVEGVPTYVVTYDRDSGTLGTPALVGYGPPANNVHNTPGITMDSKGRLHVLIGTHGRTFRYTRSLQPNDAGGGWTDPEEPGPGLRQTYVGLVCGADDTLHLVFRLWHTDTRYFPAGHYATLSYMSKRPGTDWSPPQPLLAPPFSEYSIFYHRLTIGRDGNLYLSYDYWTTYWFYRNDHRGTRRALMMSPDSGHTWWLATQEDLLSDWRTSTYPATRHTSHDTGGL